MRPIVVNSWRWCCLRIAILSVKTLFATNENMYTCTWVMYYIFTSGQLGIDSWLMMTSSNGNIFRVTGHLCGEISGHRWIPHTKASDGSLVVFFDLRLNKRLNKQSWGWCFETLSRPLWRHSNVIIMTNVATKCWHVWWLHQMETFSALLTLSVGNPPVTSGFPSHRPVKRSFDAFLICAWTNGWANKRDAGDTPSCSLGRHCNGFFFLIYFQYRKSFGSIVWQKWCHQCTSKHGWNREVVIKELQTGLLQLW